MPSNLSQVYSGILKKVDIGMGGWRLILDDGREFDLYGNIPNELAHQRVIVNGKRSEFGVGMGDGGINVASIQTSNNLSTDQSE